jgi:hypothetical protein
MRAAAGSREDLNAKAANVLPFLCVSVPMW